MSRNRYPQIVLITKRLRRLISAILIAFALLLGGPPQAARADTTVCGPVSGIWTPAVNNYIVTCDVIVNASNTLTIQPGVVVKFNPGTSLQVNGALVVNGATFTSNSTPPAKGDWGRIYFTSSSVDAVFDAGGNYLSGSKIQDSLIEWGGGGTNISAAIETNLASPYLDHNTIQNNLTKGIHAIGRSTNNKIVISRNSFSYNDAYFVDGAGIYVSSGQIINNTLSNNGAQFVGKGGGIYATDSTITGNIITANHANGEGGGVFASGSTINQNTISSNSSYSYGGGIHASSSTISDNTIVGNTAVYCSGVRAIGNSTVTNNTVENNSATSHGGGICAESGFVSDNTVIGNSSPIYGGGIYAIQATVANNQISSNDGGSGGGIYGYGANLTGNTLNNNYASSDGGGIYAHANTNVTGNTIQDNTAGRGGGIFGERVSVDNPTLSANTISGNTANSGAGIYALAATVNGNTVTGNTANGNGGGIYA